MFIFGVYMKGCKPDSLKHPDGIGSYASLPCSPPYFKCYIYGGFRYMILYIILCVASLSELTLSQIILWLMRLFGVYPGYHSRSWTLKIVS